MALRKWKTIKHLKSKSDLKKKSLYDHTLIKYIMGELTMLGRKLCMGLISSDSMWPEAKVIKLFSKLNLAEHEIYLDHKC